MIKAGTVAQIRRDAGEWLFVDIGFASARRSCGVLLGEGQPDRVTFADPCGRVLNAAALSASPLHLLIEAPLSVAFNEYGNPTGRSFERQGAKTRYWYPGLGATVMVAAMYLLRQLATSVPARDVRLFEGFVSFREKDAPSCHEMDVLCLREAVWNAKDHPEVVYSVRQLRDTPSDIVCSAFKVAGMDFGVPPVISAAPPQAKRGHLG